MANKLAGRELPQHDAEAALTALSDIVKRIVSGNQAEMAKWWKPSRYLRKQGVDEGDATPYREGMKTLTDYCKDKRAFMPSLRTAFWEAMGATYPNGVQGNDETNVSWNMPSELLEASAKLLYREKVIADLSSALSGISQSRRTAVIEELFAKIDAISATLPDYKQRRSKRVSVEIALEDPPFRNQAVGHSAPAPRPPPSFR
jgi:hypothetical protein